MKIDIWHNMMWSRYKAVVFSALQDEVVQAGDEMFVYQIAETDSDRATLSPVDMSLHKYPHELLFPGSYSRIPRLLLFATLLRRASSTDADLTIIAGFERPEYWLLLLTLMLRRRRRAVFCDSTRFDNRQTWWKTAAKRLFFRNVRAAFCYGERSAAYAKSFGVPQVFPRCQAAALPADYVAEKIPALRLAHRRAGGPQILYVGLLSKRKRVSTLLRAFRIFRDTRSSAVLRIVGKGPQEAELRELAGALDLAGDVVFTGSKTGKDLIDEYLAATCLVLPSRSEPWGLVVNEALHHGCPVIVSDRCGCVPELVELKRSGLIFACDDTNALAGALSNATRLYSDVAATALRCLETVSQFTPQHAAQQILAGARAIVRETEPMPTVSRRADAY